MPAMLNHLYPSMPWEKIDNVVFDVGNVLIVFDPPRMIEHLFPGDTAIAGRLMQDVFRSPYWIMLDRGSITVEEAARLMAKGDMDFYPAVYCMLTGWSELTRPIKEGVAAMEAARQHGKNVYLLSNYHMPWFRRAMERFSFLCEPQVDGMVISSPLHIMKPDRAIFRHMEEKYHLAPERTVFIDDAAGNVEGALNAGWQSIWYAGPGTLSSFMGFSVPQ